jgi:hypothetical protein
MAEVVVPLAVLTSTGGEVAGWDEASFDYPSCWDEAFISPAPVAARRPPRGKPQGEPFRPAPAPDWITALLRSPLLVDRREQTARRAVPDEGLRAVLAAITARGGRMPCAAFAQYLGGAPLRLNGIL